MVFGASVFFSVPSARAQWFDQGAVFSVTEENDAVSGEDRHYTQGFKLAYLHTDNVAPGWLKHCADAIPAWGFTPQATKIGAEFGQNMYTPDDLYTRQVVKDDRPYAGWLYTGFILQRRGLTAGQRPVLENFQLDIGIVGEGSLAETLQESLHSKPPKGWDNQLGSEPGFALKYMRAWLFSPQREGPRKFDFIPHCGFSAGNVDTSFRIGSTVRYGFNLPNDFGPQTINSLSTTEGGLSPHESRQWGFYVFGGGEGRAVAYNEFIDGNAFRHSHGVERETLVGELKGGAVFSWSRYELGALVIWETEEFTKQPDPDLYGSLFVKVKL